MGLSAGSKGKQEYGNVVLVKDSQEQRLASGGQTETELD